MFNLLILVAILAIILLMFDRLVGFVIVVGAVAALVVLHALLLGCYLVNGVVSYLTPFARRVRRFIRREASQA